MLIERKTWADLAKSLTDGRYAEQKARLLSAVFEGGLIAFAAVLIVWYAIAELIRGPELAQLELAAVARWVPGRQTASRRTLGAGLLRPLSLMAFLRLA